MQVSASTLQQLALEYQSLGLPAIPAYRGRPLVLWQPYQQRLPEPEEVEGWPWSKADGLAIVCGHQAPGGGFWWVLDVEHQHRAEAERWLDETHPGWRQGLVARSQRDGLHIYCRSRQPVRTHRQGWGDIKGVGSLVYAPPSKAYKPDAVGDYQWLSYQPEEALELEPADLPWPSDNGHQQGSLGREPLREVLRRTIPKGSRNITLTRIAGLLRGQLDLPPDEVLTILRVLNDSHCEEPLPDEELQAIARSSSKWSPNPTLIVGNGHHQSPAGGDGQRVRKPVRFTGRATPPLRPWLVADFIPEGLPALLYGNGGSAKSYLAMLAGLAVAAGVPWLGKPTVQRPVLYGDYELDEAEQHRRARRLAIGLGLPDVPEAFEYVQLADLSPQDAEAVLLDWVAANPNGLVIVDSIGAAATADLEKSQAVVQVFRGLRSLNPGGLLLIDHQSKLQAGQDYRDKTPFGSVYKYNLSRVVWQSELVESQPGEAWVVIRNVKNNLGPLQGEIGVRLSFEEGWVTVTTVALTSSPLVERASLETRIIATLGERGPSTAQDIADHLEANPKSVKAKLSRLKGLGRVVVAGTVGREHLWSLPGTPEYPPDNQGLPSLTLTPYRSVNVNDVVNDDPGKHHTPHGEAKIGGHGQGQSSLTLTPYMSVNVNDDPGKHHTPHREAKNGDYDPAGEAGKHHTWRHEAKIEAHDPGGEAGKHHTWLRDAKNGEHDPADDQEQPSLTLTAYMSVNVNDDPGKHHTPHHEAKNGGHGSTGEAGKHHTWLPDAENAVCEVCGQLFTWSGRGQPARYCSRTCQMKAYRQRRSSADTPGRVDFEPNGRHSPGDSSQPALVVRDDGHRPFTVHSLYSGVNSESEPNGRRSPGDSSQPTLVERGVPDDIIVWAEQLLDGIRAGRVQLPPVDLKPGHAVLVPERFLASHITEAKLGISVALENLRLFRRAVERAGMRRGGK